MAIGWSVDELDDSKSRSFVHPLTNMAGASEMHEDSGHKSRACSATAPPIAEASGAGGEAKERPGADEDSGQERGYTRR